MAERKGLEKAESIVANAVTTLTSSSERREAVRTSRRSAGATALATTPRRRSAREKGIGP
jgi:hypothetical protein